MHEDHRKRTKARFLAEGLENFEPHNVLELLLFYTIPQKDTNEIAHTLINRFGSLSGVFDASFEDLISVNGVSEHTATLIKMIPQLSRKYIMEKNAKATTLRTLDDIGKYLVARYVGVNEETVLMLLLDNKFSLIDCITVHVGSVNSSAITMRKLIETALFKRASMVILAHNHPSGVTIPSSDDIATTKAVKRAFDLVGIGMPAHILVAGNEYVNILDK
ncbi:MAG: RadC family protein [Clostridia bacterium]|nr:RadC family protein [Clostridia bacterium]